MLNNDFPQLVKKYERYKGQKRNKIFLSLFAFAIILVVGFWLISKNNFIINSFKKTVPESNITMTPVVTPPSVKEVKVIKEAPLERVKVDTPQVEKAPDQVYQRSTKQAEKQNSFKLQVNERKSLYKLLTEHKEKNTYQSAINIAQFYFDEKDYAQAITWSVKASKQDPRQSLPWIIYAKSKVTQGKTKVAKKALSIYLKHTNSKEVQNLLDSLK
ncbi:MAG: hypothetical protein K0U47_05915 [Epsilonproteobacteria bacterium]|nr:hypothetical protein [Campylobacterota bacterium]